MTELQEESLDLWIIGNWVIGDGHTSSDYQLTSGEIEGLPELHLQNTIRFDYNQWKQSWSKCSCTIFSALGAISDLWDYEFPLSEIKEYDELSYTLGRTRWDGWYTKDAIDMCVKKWNKDHTDKPVVYYSVLASNDEDVNKILDKNYDFNISFNYTQDYVEDLNENWMIDRANKWERIVWHAVCQIKKDWYKSVKDNYAWSKHQYYRVNVTNKELRNANILHAWGYVIVKVKDNLEELKRLEQVKTACLNACEYNSALRHLTNSQELKDKLHQANEAIRNISLKYIEETIWNYR